MSDSEAPWVVRPRSIDLNADLGEGFPNDRALLDRVTSASVCCGAHAGDAATIGETLRRASQAGVVVGAHPGFADRQGFGRRMQSATAGEVERLILDQVTALKHLADLARVPIRLAFVKPHGALYNQAQNDDEIGRGVIAAVCQLGLPLLGQPGTRLETLARGKGVHFVAEGFPDRRYRLDGSLVPRGEPVALIHDRDELESQVVRLVSERRVATLCIHGDEPEAVANADRIRDVLTRHGTEIRNFMNL